MEGGPPMFRQDFTCPALLEDQIASSPVRGCHPLLARLSRRFRLSTTMTTGLVRVRSPLLAESRLMSFPPATEMFQFPGFASPTYVFSRRYPHAGGLPHSEIRGSTSARLSPRLIAACHVLHRLSVPRHPPDALNTLDHASTWRGVSPANSVTRRDKTLLRHRACNPVWNRRAASKHLLREDTHREITGSSRSDRSSNRLTATGRTKPMDLTDSSVHTYPQRDTADRHRLRTSAREQLLNFDQSPITGDLGNRPEHAPRWAAMHTTA